jgi:type II secretory pathway pseudopilin PulG
VSPAHPTARLSADRVTGDAGTSLIEVLMAVVILGLAGAAILGGFLASVRGSDLHRQQSQVESALVSAVEALKDPAVARVPCATASNASYLSAVRSATLPAGWSSTSTVRITAIRYADGLAYGTTCQDTDALRHLLRSQMITVQVSSPDGRARQAVSVVKGTNA